MCGTMGVACQCQVLLVQAQYKTVLPCLLETGGGQGDVSRSSTLREPAEPLPYPRDGQGSGWWDRVQWEWESTLSSLKPWGWEVFAAACPILTTSFLSQIIWLGCNYARATQ